MGAARRVGRYELFAPIASGGMATVHLGRLVGTAGFSRTVAVKRLHDQYTRDRSFVEALLEEARLTARISHPNVAQTLDVVSIEDDVFLVLEYVHGASLAMLMKLCAGGLPPAIACSIVSQALHGLHAAHEAMSATREPFGIVHQDVSPQNIMVGADGAVRVIDFGIAKATRRVPSKDDQNVRGKVRYMSPEQMRGGKVDRRTDVFAAGIVLYELLTGQRYYGDLTAQAIMDDARARVPKVPGVGSAALGAIVTRALAAAPEDRFATAAEMALAIEETEGIAPQARVGEWLREIAADILEERAELVAEVEKAATGELPALGTPWEDDTGVGTGPHLRGLVTRPQKRPSDSRLTASLVVEPPAEEAKPSPTELPPLGKPTRSAEPDTDDVETVKKRTKFERPEEPTQTKTAVKEREDPTVTAITDRLDIEEPTAPKIRDVDDSSHEEPTLEVSDGEDVATNKVVVPEPRTDPTGPGLPHEHESRLLSETISAPIEDISAQRRAVTYQRGTTARPSGDASDHRKYLAAAVGFGAVLLVGTAMWRSSGTTAAPPAPPSPRVEMPVAAELPPPPASVVPAVTVTASTAPTVSPRAVRPKVPIKR